MAQPYVGEIRMFGGNFEPDGWKFCDGQLLPIATNDTLFQLIGTSFGGDGQENFALPDLRGRVPIHRTDALSYAQAGGVEAVTLTQNQIPIHSHPLVASTDAGGPNPAGNVLATSLSVDVYRESSATSAMSPQAIGPTGGSQPHSNLQPYLCVNFIISLFGLFPSQT